MTNYAVIEKLRTRGLFLDENTRLRIDYAGTRLRDVLPDFEIAVLPYRQARGLDVAVDTFSLNAELEKLKEELFDSELDNWEIFAAHLAGEKFFSCVMELAGNYQGEWADVIVYARDPIQDETKNFIREIFRGDSYNIYKEERTVFTAPDGRTREEWETLEMAFDYAESDVWAGVYDLVNVWDALGMNAFLRHETLSIAPQVSATVTADEKQTNHFNLRIQKRDSVEINSYTLTREALTEAIFCHEQYLNRYAVKNAY